jgi:hypothetical protein
VVQRLSIIKKLARRCENLACRTGVDVPLLVEGEVFSTECPILALRLVDHRDMRRYLRLIDQPVEVGSGIKVWAWHEYELSECLLLPPLFQDQRTYISTKDR